METIGDAYHIVGGLPEFTTDHADKVIAMAFDMIDVCVTVISPANGKPIQVCFFDLWPIFRVNSQNYKTDFHQTFLEFRFCQLVKRECLEMLNRIQTKLIASNFKSMYVVELSMYIVLRRSY